VIQCYKKTQLYSYTRYRKLMNSVVVTSVYQNVFTNIIVSLMHTKDVIKMVPVVALFSTQHIMVLSQEL